MRSHDGVAWATENTEGAAATEYIGAQSPTGVPSDRRAPLSGRGRSALQG
jgi:hypothetical protein